MSLTEPIPTGLTYLGNPDEPSFIVGVLGPNNGSKPAIGSAMMGPLVEFIANFWPLWDSEAGSNLQDIGIGLAGTIIGSSIAWGACLHGQGLTSAGIVGSDDLTIPRISLTGGYSIERLYQKAGSWIHEILVNDPDLLISTKYLNGVAQPSTPFNTNILNISSLVSWDGSGLTTPMKLEFARIWNRALTPYEVADLHSNPYMMFGVTQQLLDEITVIINFMKPMRTSWNFDIE